MSAGDRTDAALRAAGEAFAGPGGWRGGEPLGRGLIHRSFVARLETAGTARRVVLQRLNTEVFREPEVVMENVARVTRHLRAGLEAEGCPDPERRCLELVRTRGGDDFHRDPQGGIWRCFRYVEGSRNVEALEGTDQAREAARAFGAFARRLSDLPGPTLRETIPHFHDFQRRLAALDAAVAVDRRRRAGAVQAEVRALRARSAEVAAALAARGGDALPRRVVHHDCKLDNLLFDAAGREALCVIDLDTVMPGILLSDFGELVRSSTNRGAEDERHLEAVDFDLELFDALARGYLEGVGPLASAAERAALPLAGPLLTLMNAVRFLTDHLEGDVYFAISRPGHNLDRARAQLHLAERMLAQREGIEASVAAAARG